MAVTSKLARFGAFELDLNSGELSKNGRKLKLQEQPFRILTLRPVYHFHNARLDLINAGTGTFDIGVARDKVVMALGELTGNIWRLKR